MSVFWSELRSWSAIQKIRHRLRSKVRSEEKAQLGVQGWPDGAAGPPACSVTAIGLLKGVKHGFIDSVV